MVLTHVLTRFLLVALLLLSSGCELFRKVTKEREDVAWRRTLSGTLAQRPQFEKLSLSGKIRVDSPEGDFSGVSATYRIDLRRDSAMLIRLSKFIEVARIKIDQDSIYVLDRLGSTYRVCDFSLAESYTGLEVDFEALQDLLLGNFHPIPEDLSPENTDSLPQTFVGSEAGTEFRYFIDPLIFKLLQFEAQNLQREINSTVVYRDFSGMAGAQVPQTVLIEAATPDAISIELDHRRLDFDPGRVSFELGDVSGYERKGCNF